MSKKHSQQESPTSSKLKAGKQALNTLDTLWRIGDWKAIAQSKYMLSKNQKYANRIALLIAAANLQLGHTTRAKKILNNDVLYTNCNRKLISQILISGVYNSLGRIAAISDQREKAHAHFHRAISTCLSDSEVAVITNDRMNSQIEQIEKIRKYSSIQPLKVDKRVHNLSLSTKRAEILLQQALKTLPDDPVLLVAYAESAMQSNANEEAIRRWQHLAAIMGENMPKPYYDRLLNAYRNLKTFPPGTPEEEHLSGDLDKYELLKHFHQRLSPDFYLEIGIQTGKSLALAECPAIGIDPMPQIKYSLRETAKIEEATSDKFFSNTAKGSIASPDLAFIDGMHLFEFTLRDFINVEKNAKRSTLIVIDDIFPGHPAQAERHRRTRAWTGDVWKLLLILQEYRPDLYLRTLDAYPTGLLIVTGLNPEDMTLIESYDEIVKKYSDKNIIPDSVLRRVDTWSCKDQRIDQLLDEIKMSRSLQEHGFSLTRRLNQISKINY